MQCKFIFQNINGDSQELSDATIAQYSPDVRDAYEALKNQVSSLVGGDSQELSEATIAQYPDTIILGYESLKNRVNNSLVGSQSDLSSYSSVYQRISNYTEQG